MKSGSSSSSEAITALDLVERATHLVRQVPLGVTLCYYVGAVPFVLLLLFFLVDMSANPFAQRHGAGVALGLALLHVWMRIWQSRYSRHLMAHLAGEKLPVLKVRDGVRLFFFHAIYSSWGVVAVPLAALFAIPWAWVVAWYNTLCAVDPQLDRAAAMAWRAARVRPKENHLALIYFSLFGFFIFLNVMVACIWLPGLLKSLLGVETVFSRHAYWFMNSTFWISVAALTYLVFDPLLKAFYVLRLQGIESISDGTDLLAEIRCLPPPRRRIGAGVRAGIVALLLGFAPPGAIASPVESEAVDPATLDARIDAVMRRPEFTWRMPREAFAPEEPSGFIASVSQWLDGVGDKILAFFEWIEDWVNRRDARHRPSRTSSEGGIAPSVVQGIAVVLIVGLFVLLVRLVIGARWRRLRGGRPELDAVAVAPRSVDLEDESLVATELAEDEWIALGRELAAAGEMRKALRAWFLAALAYLARTDRVSIRLSKTNRDYQRELERRARRAPALSPLFAEGVDVFERAWYGQHPVSIDELVRLERIIERMRHEMDA